MKWYAYYFRIYIFYEARRNRRLCWHSQFLYTLIKVEFFSSQPPPSRKIKIPSDSNTLDGLEEQIVKIK